MPKSNDNDKVLTDVEKMESLYKLRSFLTDTDKLKNLHADDSYLERYLYSTDFDVEAAFTKMMNFYELLLEYPNWFPKEGPLDKKSIIDRDIRIMLPHHDKEGRIIYIHKLGNIDMDTMALLDIISVDDIWVESVLENIPRISEKGISIIVDVYNYQWKMLKWLTPENIRVSIKKFLALPLKDFRFHVVNKSMIIHIAIKITWPLLPTSIKEKVKFHFDDWDSLYQHFDKVALPPEYGGTYTVNYKELYENLYGRNEEILKKLMLYRNI